MSQKIFSSKVTAVTITFLLLVFSYILLYVYAEKLAHQSNWIIHTHVVMDRLEKLSSQNQQLDNNYDAYIITSNQIYKDAFYKVEKITDSLVKQIRFLVSDNNAQIRILDQKLKTGLSKKISGFKNGIALVEASSFDKIVKDSLLYTSLRKGDIMSVEKSIRNMESGENELLRLRTSELDNFSTIIKIINLISLLMALGFSFFAFKLYKKEFQNSKLAAEQNEKYRLELELRVEELAKANARISELKETEKFASTGRIARTIAHEIRNPLTNINLAAEQLKISIADEEERTMLFDMLGRNSTRINELISNLLNATRFMELTPELISINDVIQSALLKARDRIELRHIDIITNFDKDICDVSVDGEKMQLAFLNIIVNAIEAMPAEGGMLQISTFQDADDKCHIIFKDNGKGMDDDIKLKIFEPFFTAKENGNGLGMTNTQNIVLNHKGKIYVESELGKGSTFEIIL